MKPKVTDHALIRYFERRHGLSFAETRKEILTPAVKQAVRAGATAIKTDIGTFKIKNGNIVTFIGKQAQ